MTSREMPKNRKIMVVDIRAVGTASASGDVSCDRPLDFDRKKGQLIPKWNFDVFKSTKKTMKTRISDLTSMGTLNQNNKDSLLY